MENCSSYQQIKCIVGFCSRVTARGAAGPCQTRYLVGNCGESEAAGVHKKCPVRQTVDGEVLQPINLWYFLQLCQILFVVCSDINISLTNRAVRHWLSASPELLLQWFLVWPDPLSEWAVQLALCGGYDLVFFAGAQIFEPIFILLLDFQT